MDSYSFQKREEEVGLEIGVKTECNVIVSCILVYLKVFNTTLKTFRN